jgi:Tfp pilus assembly protein PilO
MKKVRLGKTGLMVSEVGFGGIPIVALGMEEAMAVVRHCFELGITFKVTGRYAQFVDLLNALRASPQFLVVDTIRLTGEKGTASDELKVGIHISTYLARADETLLKALTAGKKTGGGAR